MLLLTVKMKILTHDDDDDDDVDDADADATDSYCDDDEKKMMVGLEARSMQLLH